MGENVTRDNFLDLLRAIMTLAVKDARCGHDDAKTFLQKVGASHFLNHGKPKNLVLDYRK